MLEKVLKILAGVFFLTFILFGSIYLSETGTEPPALEKADAIVLLSGSYKERAPAVLELVRNGYADKVLLTNEGDVGGWSPKYNRNLSQVEWVEESLVASGVKREQIFKLPGYVDSTMSEAVEASRYVQQKGMKKIIIVTSDYHLTRALWAFRKAFDGYAAELMVYPAVSGAPKVETRIVEFAKLIYYQVRYGFADLGQRK